MKDKDGFGLGHFASAILCTYFQSHLIFGSMAVIMTIFDTLIVDVMSRKSENRDVIFQNYAARGRLDDAKCDVRTESVQVGRHSQIVERNEAGVAALYNQAAVVNHLNKWRTRTDFELENSKFMINPITY